MSISAANVKRAEQSRRRETVRERDYYHHIRAAYLPKFKLIQPNFMALSKKKKSKTIATAARYVSACHKLRLSASGQNGSTIISFMLYKVYVYVTDVYARGVNVNLTPLTSNRGALATDARGCSLWRSLLERPPPAPESRVRDPLGTRYEFGLCGRGRG